MLRVALRDFIAASDVDGLIFMSEYLRTRTGINDDQQRAILNGRRATAGIFSARERMEQ